MDFFDDFGRKVGETVKVVGDKSKQIAEISKINLDIGKEEAIIKRLYSKIGEAVFRAHQGENETAETIDDLCREVGERRERIQDLNNRIKELKSL